MNIKKQILMTAIAVFVVSVLAIKIADAATTSTSITVNAANTLTISAPASVTMPSVTVGSTSQVSGPQAMGTIEVDDTRSTTPGWTATAQLTSNFTDGGNTIALGNLVMTLGTPASVPGSFPSGTVTAGSNITFANTTTNYTMMTAANANGHGGWTQDNNLTLTVPGWQPAGSYSATLTETVS